jgi:hypothetical protein
MYSTNKVIRGRNVIINGNLSTTNGAKVTIYATSITVEPNSVISPDIEIVSVEDILEQKSLEPVSVQKIKTFCDLNSSLYKAKEPLFKSVKVPQQSTINNSTSSISLHPNPTSSKTTLTLSGFEHTNVSVMIFDLIGREVYTQLEKDITAREHQAVLNTEMLQAGTYIVKIFNGREEKVAKLVILKN